MDSLGIAIFGYGFIGRVHAYCHRNLTLFYDPPPLHTRLIGVCTSRPETARRAAADGGFEFGVTDPAEILSRDDVSVVHICTPNDSHCELVRAALQAGKHVYCDKPLTADLAEAEALAPHVETGPGRLGLTFNYRFLPATLRAKQLIEQGALGRIYSFRGAYLHAGYIDPARPFSWRLDRARGRGGALVDLGSHIIDLLQHLIGPFVEVNALTETFIRERPAPDDPSRMMPVEVDDVALLSVRTACGALGHVEASRLATGTNDELRFEIHGATGALRFNLQDPNFLEFYDATASDGSYGGNRGFTRLETVQRYESPAGFPGPKFAIGWLRAHMHCLWSFLQDIASGTETSANYAAGLAVERVMDAAYRSAESRRPVEIPPPA